MESQGVKQEVIAGSLNSYARKYLPDLKRRRGASDEPSSNRILPDEDQKLLVEEIDKLLPIQKGLVPTKFLFGLFRTAKILRADPICISNMEKRIGLQFDQATLEDLLMPSFSYSTETLYDVDCVQRILEHFLTMDEAVGDASPGSVDDGRLMGSPSLVTPITMVSKLMDGYLAEVAPDVNMKLPKFQSLAAAVPEYARSLYDGLYRAIDTYLKSSSMATRIRPRTTLSTNGLPEAVTRSLHTRSSKRKAAFKNNSPSPLLRAASIENFHSQLLLSFRQPGWVKATDKRADGPERRWLDHGCKREPGPESGYGQYENEGDQARKGVLRHETGNREVGKSERIEHLGELVEEVWDSDEVSNVQCSRGICEHTSEQPWECKD
ncbi:hypothetical protein OROGR_000930 [Orobanche gracilis]